MAKQTQSFDFTLGHTDEISAAGFINEKLKLYSSHSNVRGIPFIGDGMKQAHRKAIYGMVVRGENSDYDTVERLSARAAADTDYHHGTGSMAGCLVTLAQNFTGANNINLVEPKGQFGSRLNNKAAAPRYIKAKLSPNFRKLFKKEDDLILEYHQSNGERIEPHFFIPILPMSLVNGTEGMGTGHSTYILNYNPLDLKAAILQVLRGQKLTPYTLTPWFNGFTGTVERDPNTHQVIITGKYEVVNSGTIKVSELPIGIQNDGYEAHLHKLAEKEKIKSFINQSDKNGFDFTISVPRFTSGQTDDELKKLLKLVSRESENLTLWDTNGVLKRYDCAEQIIEEFVAWRLARYEDRRQALIRLTEAEICWLDERIRFIKFWLANTNELKGLGKKELLARLAGEAFSQPEKLLNMSIWSLTKEKVEELEQELAEKVEYLEKLMNDTPKEMYSRELKELKL